MPVAKTWEQHKEECQLIAESKQIQILGWVGEWKGNRTKLGLSCHCGNRWQSTSITDFKNGRGCPECGREKIRQASIKPDDEMIASFHAKRQYPVGTIFKRSDRLNKQGYASYWSVYCPVCAQDEIAQAGLCSGWFESSSGHLQEGQIACRCSSLHKYTDDQHTFRAMKLCEDNGYQFVGWVGKIGAVHKFKYLCSDHGEQTMKFDNMHYGKGCPGCAGKNQKELYINLISDESGSTYAAKLGISNNSDRRIKEQNTTNNHTMKRALLFLFDAVQDCKDTEQYLKHHVPSIGYVPDLHMKDGSTETFALDDLDYVVQTIKQRGGVLQEENYVS